MFSGGLGAPRNICRALALGNPLWVAVVIDLSRQFWSGDHTWRLRVVKTGQVEVL